MRVGDRARKYDQAAIRLASSRGNSALEIGAFACTSHGHVHVQGRRGSLDGVRHAHLS
jgi:hypothetical protein